MTQSPWCNTVMLVRKKDGTLRFCIDFRCLECPHQEGFIPNTQMPGDYGVPGWSSLLLHHGPQERLLAS